MYQGTLPFPHNQGVLQQRFADIKKVREKQKHIFMSSLKGSVAEFFKASKNEGLYPRFRTSTESPMLPARLEIM
jgi:hypothetical protein